MTPVLIALLGTTELMIILVIVVLIFGVGKLPQVGKQLGEGIRNFKDEVSNPGEDEEPKKLGEHTVDETVQPETERPRDVTGAR